MDPRTGDLYESVDEAKKAGVKKPVEIVGTRKQAERISVAVSALHASEQERKKRNQKKRKNAKAARKKNRQ